MLKRLACTLTGGHRTEVAREAGAMFLRCERCGWRSSGVTIPQRDAVPLRPSSPGGAGPIDTLFTERSD